MSQYKITRYPPLFRALFLDLLFDRKACPIFLSAFLMIVSGATLYHWLVG